MMLLSALLIEGFAQIRPIPLSDQEAVIEFYVGVSPVTRMGLMILVTFVAGLTVLGLLPGYSTQTIETARRSPLISILVGIPTALAIVALAYVGIRLSHSDLGVFFAIPLVTIGLTLLPAWALMAAVATGNSLTARVGRDGLTAGLTVSALLIGVSAVIPMGFVGLFGFLACYGAGAGARVLISGGAATDPSERSVPPANKI